MKGLPKQIPFFRGDAEKIFENHTNPVFVFLYSDHHSRTDYVCQRAKEMQQKDTQNIIHKTMRTGQPTFGQCADQSAKPMSHIAQNRSRLGRPQLMVYYSRRISE